MSTISLPPGGAGGRIPTTPTSSSTAMRQLPKPTMSPRSSASSSAHPTLPPSSDLNTDCALGRLAEDSTSKHDSSSLLPLSRSADIDEWPSALSTLPALPSSETPQCRSTNPSAKYSDPTPSSTGNDVSERDTNGGNVVRVRSPVPELEIVEFAPIDLARQKYRREVYYPSDPDDSKIKKFQPFKRKFTRPGVPRDWTAYECPEGKLYFYNESRRVLTMTDIEVRDNLRQIQQAMDDLRARLEAANFPVDDDAEIVLMKTVKSDSKEDIMAYYVASMSDQSIFWCEEVIVEYLTDGERAVVSEPHLEKAVRAQFWYSDVLHPLLQLLTVDTIPFNRQHVEMFPNHRGLSSAAINDLNDAFAYGLCDYVTSQTSMFPYDPNTVEYLTKCIAGIEPGAINASHSAAAARLLSTICISPVCFCLAVLITSDTLDKERFLHFHGETGARLDRKDSVFFKNTKGPRSLFFMISSPFLFLMPFVYLSELERIYIDNCVHHYVWRNFCARLRRDWESSITPITVLLSANVGFLAINSIDTASPNRSAAQIASYTSSVLGLFMYIVVHILNRKTYYLDAEGQVDRVMRYTLKREDDFFGLGGVAMVLSLPTALFLWSTAAFFVALLFVFFDDTSTATKIAMGTVLGFLALVLAFVVTVDRSFPMPRTAEVFYDVIRMMFFAMFRGVSWVARGVFRLSAAVHHLVRAGKNMHTSHVSRRARSATRLTTTPNGPANVCEYTAVPKSILDCRLRSGVQDG